ncbi:glycoside hydrolase [Lentinus tigrinus ALCF2SS1-6]|uniref:beta-N-acetylhexosaminidase n=1 Tax=Lentinus tigrinus ALCF2SS1-6 TaxID=1328759 RepID=A0A5C2S116_9APHY|nr:glycoside hydrolase [Lentinus tigrinus ALCF2SS1-6]
MSPCKVIKQAAYCCLIIFASVFALPGAALNLPPLVPAVHSFTANSGASGAFRLSNDIRLIVDGHDAQSTRDNGLTLIPPTLLSFAQTFKTDLETLFPHTSVTLSIGDTQALPVHPTVIAISLSDRVNATHADGTTTTEGYELQVLPTSIRITASGSKGAFWGTRTLLQGLVLAGEFPLGTVVDQPDWQTRGFMLDVGRQWYPITFLRDLCTYASWFKVSEFHVHLSDNVSPRGNPNAYARFRLRPEDSALAGLTPHLNETYSRAEFEDFQTHCAARGVTIIPELESPGHALVITQWRPELALSSDPTLINLTVPDAIPTIKAIWKEFLPWFHTKQVSIGADEYNSSLADDYNNFVNEMSDFIGQESGKTIRIWGTREPSNTTSVSKNITIQHWDFGDDDPFELIRSGYDVINSEDSFQYIVMKQSGSFPQQLNQTRLWEGANVDTGGIWDPHVFDRGNASNNPRISDPHLKGAIMAAWNDHGPTASTFLEAFYALKEGIPVVASVGWLAASGPNHLTHAQFLEAFAQLEASAPGQNLDRRIPSKSAMVVAYAAPFPKSGIVPDRSGNGYDAHFDSATGSLHTPLGSKGHNYTLLLRATLDGSPGTLLSGPDESFGVASRADGALTLAFTSSDITYLLSNYTLSWGSGTVEIVLTGTQDGTSVFVDGTHAGDFLVSIDGTNVFEPMAFVAPLQIIGGEHSEVKELAMWDGIHDANGLSSVEEMRGI